MNKNDIVALAAMINDCMLELALTSYKFNYAGVKAYIKLIGENKELLGDSYKQILDDACDASRSVYYND